MGKMECDKLSRGDLARSLGKTLEDFKPGFDGAVREAMNKVEGAELVCILSRSASPTAAIDEHDFVYHLSPEGVTLHIGVGVDIDRTLFGEPDKITSVYRRVYNAFSK